MRPLPLAAISALLLSTAAATAQDTPVVLTGGRVLPVDRPPIDPGVVIMHRGTITAVGEANMPVPPDSESIDCTGKVITPGLVDAATSLGLSSEDANEQGDEVTPHVRVLDAIDPADPRFARARRAGVTTAQVSPGNRNVVGGLGCVIKTAGDHVAGMLVRDASCLRVAMGGEPSAGNRAIRFGTPNSIYYRRPTTRMGVVWAVRKAFYDAQSYREQQTNNVVDGPSMVDPAMDVLVEVLDRKMHVRTTARAEQDIRTALRLAAEFGYETVIEEATEAYLVTDELAAAGVTLVLAGLGLESGRDGAEPRYHTAAQLAAAGVPFAIATGSSLGDAALVQEAMFAMRNGLSADQALAATTAVPAAVLGVADQLGTLTVGKAADVVVWNGSPFAPTTTATRVFIDGKEVQ